MYQHLGSDLLTYGLLEYQPGSWFGVNLVWLIILIHSISIISVYICSPKQSFLQDCFMACNLSFLSCGLKEMKRLDCFFPLINGFGFGGRGLVFVFRLRSIS